jgi:hypothetical protein
LSAVIVVEIPLSGPFGIFTPLNLEIIQPGHDSDSEADLSAGIVADLTGVYPVKFTTVTVKRI